MDQRDVINTERRVEEYINVYVSEVFWNQK